MENTVKMAVTWPTYLVLRELLWNIRLGDRNIFERHISHFARLMEEEEAEYPEDFSEAEAAFSVPQLHFEFSNDEGFVINILEE